jgi:hypothetical protein
MKIAIIITGIARYVQLGYEQFYKPLIEKYNPDIFIYTWNDYEVNEIKKYYSPKKIEIVEPINFSEYSFHYNVPNYIEKYGSGSLLPMVYCWENAIKMVDVRYDCIIRSRFDVKIDSEINIENMDLSKINISDSHWKGSSVMDDNLLISNQENVTKIYENIFTDISSKTQPHQTNEINFTDYVNQRGLGDKVVKINLPFKLARHE